MSSKVEESLVSPIKVNLDYKTRGCSMLGLPEVIGLKIFSHLDISVITRSSSVSHEFRDFTNSPFLWRMLLKRDYFTEFWQEKEWVNVAEMKDMYKRAYQIRRLIVKMAGASEAHCEEEINNIINSLPAEILSSIFDHLAVIIGTGSTVNAEQLASYIDILKHIIASKRFEEIPTYVLAKNHSLFSRDGMSPELKDLADRMSETKKFTDAESCFEIDRIKTFLIVKPRFCDVFACLRSMRS